MNIWSALGKVVIQAGPTALSFALQHSVFLITLLFMQTFEQPRLNGVGLGNMVGAIFGISVGWGLAGGLDTLCSQANGARDFRKTGIWLQRGILILTIVSIPIWVAYVYTEKLLLAIYVDPETAMYAGNYMIRLTPGIWFFLIFDCIRRYLQCQGYYWTCLVVNLVTTAMHVQWCWFFIVNQELAEVGAGIATAITYFCDFFFALILIRVFSLGQKTWTLVSTQQMWQDIAKYLKYAIPAAVMQIIDTFTYEVTMIGAIFLGPNEASAHVMTLTTNCVLWMISVGISTQTCAVIGNFLGDKKPKTAKKMAFASFLLIWILYVPIMALVWIFRNEVAESYTRYPETLEIIKSWIPWMLVTTFLDAIHTVFMGIWKALALQKVASILELVCYYVIGIPVGYYLTFHTPQQILGLWIGLMAGALLSSISLAIVVCKATWRAKTIDVHEVRV